MTESEGIRSPERKNYNEPAASAAPVVAASTSANVPFRSLPVQTGQLRFWALPDRPGKWWILRENDPGTVSGLVEGAPVIFIPPAPPQERVAAAECCRGWIRSRLQDRCHENAFQLIKRLLLGGVILIGSAVGLELPGELKFLDMWVFGAAIVFCGYTALRYGTRFLNSAAAVQHPFAHFSGEPFVENALCARLANAIQVRRSLPPEARGTSPDEELLDANAFRKLIREKVTTREELFALGRAVQNRLGVGIDEPRKLSEISAREDLDSESAAVYRDLALAAGELALEPEM